MTTDPHLQKIKFLATGKHLPKGLLLACTLLLSACSGTPAENLGVHDGQLAPCPNSPNCVSSQASDADHKVDPLPLLGSAENTRETLLKLINSQPGARLVDQDTSYLRAEYTSDLLRFVDDVEFMITASDVQVRSASRLGYSDLGVNRKRVEQLRQRMLQLPQP